MTATRIYQLDTANQSDIISTHCIPAEDVAGVDTVKLTLSQLAQYLFSTASLSSGIEPFGNFNLIVGNESYAAGSDSSAIGPRNNASDGGDPVVEASAFGYQNIASGNWGSSAFGYKNTANHSQSSAFGHKNIASDRHASAFGTDNTASGVSSTAIGRNNTASGYGATASGYHNTASNDYTTACGYNNGVYGDYGQAFGLNNTVGDGPFIGKRCVAVGISNSASGNYQANDGQSVALGYNNTTTGYRCSSIGVSNTVATMGFVTEGSAVGYQNAASGNWGSSAFGYRNNASSSRTTAFGHKNTANDAAASAIGNYNTASGYGSTACGYDNISSNIYSNAIGYNNTASANHGSAIGYNNTASASWGTSAFGHENTASSNQASAFGHNNTASGHSSSAFGFGCNAYVSNSSAFGYNAVARCSGTTNIGGTIIVRADDGENFNASDAFSLYSGAQNIVMTADVDLTVATHSIFYVGQRSNGSGYQIGDTVYVSGGNGDAVLTVSSVDSGAPVGWTITNGGSGYSDGSGITTTVITGGGDGGATVDIATTTPVLLTVPAGSKFYVDEVGVITSDGVNTVSAQPHIQFGWTGTNNGFLSTTTTTNLVANGSREVYTSLSTNDGKTTLNASIITPATATHLHGRFYFKGMLIENTPVV